MIQPPSLFTECDRLKLYVYMFSDSKDLQPIAKLF